MPELVAGAKTRETLHKRNGVLQTLSERPRTKPELVDETEYSRSTIDRSIADLEECRLVTRTGKKYRPTPLGECCLREYLIHEATIDNLSKGASIVNSISEVDSIDQGFFRGMRSVNANPKVPESALKPMIRQLEESDRLRGLVQIAFSLFPQILEEFILEEGLQVEVILNRSTLDSLLELDRERLRVMTENGKLDVFETEEQLPYGLWIMEQSDDSFIGVMAYENGGLQGVLTNEREVAREWAEAEYMSYRTTATKVSLPPAT